MPNQVWSADFMNDSPYRGALFRLFNVNEDYNRESLAIAIDTSLRAIRLVRMFERQKETRGLLDILRVDNGPEFLGQVFVDWCAANGRASQAKSECVHRAIQLQPEKRGA